MSDDSNVVSLNETKNSDLALLKAKAADLKVELNNKFRELCGVLDKMSDAGISIEFNFTRPLGASWQVTSKVFKEL